jgi:16S rRNA (cytidine1402-2'-O)-methyltransferase
VATLFVVATPIGNLEDITLRAVRVLGEVDLVLAEDTRVTKKLLNHLSIRTRVVRCDDVTSEGQIGELLRPLREGKNVALVTDAGTPNISDPGWRVVRAALAMKDADISVIPIPGPSALTAILSVVHFPVLFFHFYWFPPAKKGRKTFFEGIEELANSFSASDPVAILFYESPHRILKTLDELADRLPTFEMMLGKELTKVHERIWRGSVKEISREFRTLPDKERRGEYVIVIGNTYGKK